MLNNGRNHKKKIKKVTDIKVKMSRYVIIYGLWKLKNKPRYCDSFEILDL